MIVNSDDKLERIDNFISSKNDISRSKVQKLIKSDKILVNGLSVKSNYVVKVLDEISILEEEKEEMDIVGQDIYIDVVYEDDDLLVINKASGMVVHPAAGHYTDTLVNALLYRFDLSNMDSDRPGIVHRLDKDTSGLMLVAKNDFTHEALSKMIANREVTRKYISLVSGVLRHESATIDAPIGRDINNRQKQAVTALNSRDAVTHIKVLERYGNHTLIEAKLETGRTHQIRVHLNYIGHPVVNDPVYSNKKSNDFGQLLHSKYISFKHPRTGEELSFEVDVPEEFKNIVDSYK